MPRSHPRAGYPDTGGGFVDVTSDLYPNVGAFYDKRLGRLLDDWEANEHVPSPEERDEELAGLLGSVLEAADGSVVTRFGVGAQLPPSPHCVRESPRPD
jgi:hypothetical protein